MVVMGHWWIYIPPVMVVVDKGHGGDGSLVDIDTHATSKSSNMIIDNATRNIQQYNYWL